jgi:hypothetical protein
MSNFLKTFLNDRKRFFNKILFKAKQRISKRKNIFLMLSNHLPTNWLSLFGLKNQNAFFHFVFKQNSKKFDFYSNKQLLFIKTNKTESSFLFDRQFLIDLKKSKIKRSKINLLILLPMDSLVTRYSKMRQLIMRQIELIEKIIKYPLRMYIIITDIESIDGFNVFSRFAKLSSLYSISDFLLALDEDNLSIRDRFNQFYDAILTRIFDEWWRVTSKTNEENNVSICRLLSTLIFLKTKLNQLLGQLFLTFPETIRLQCILPPTFSDTELKKINQFIRFRARFKKWLVVLIIDQYKRWRFIQVILWVTTFSMIMIFLKGYVELRHKVNFSTKGNLFSVKFDIRKPSSKFLKSLSQLNHISAICYVAYPYVSFKIKHTVKHLKKIYIQYIICAAVKASFMDFLSRQGLSVGEQYIYLISYLSLNSRHMRSFPELITTPRWVDIKNSRFHWLDGLLLFWKTYQLPAILLNKTLIQKNAILLSKMSCVKLFFSILQACFNKDTIYGFQFYNKHFAKLVYDFLEASVSFHLIAEEKRAEPKTKAIIYHYYFNQYIQYWISTLNDFKFPIIHSLKFDIKKLKDFTQKNAIIDRRLNIFYKNVNPLLVKRISLPDTVIELNRWISDSKNIDVFKSQLSMIIEKLEHVFNAKDSNERCLRIFKDAFDGKKDNNNLIGMLIGLDKNLPILIRKPVKALATQLIQRLLEKAIVAIKIHWTNNVLNVYQKNIESYYPVNVFGEDVPIDHFTNFFKKEGVLFRFFTEEISPFLTAKSQSFIPHYFKEKMSDIEPLLHQLLDVRKKFSNSSGDVKLKFYIQPISAGNAFKNIQLAIDNVNIHYAHGPNRRFLYQWPNNSPDKKLLLVCRRFSGSNVRLSIAGPWAFFRFLNAEHANWQGNMTNQSFKIFIKRCAMLLNVLVITE